MLHYPHLVRSVAGCWIQIGSVLLAASLQAQVNDWISPVSGNWDNVANWSAGLPNASQLEVCITNMGSKAVAIQPTTPVVFPNSMTVRNLRVGGVSPDTNLLLLNFSGTTTPLRVLHDLNIQANGRILMLYSGLNVSNALNLNGVLDQQGGELTFTNSLASTMQIEGGQFNLTNGVVAGRNLFLGGTNDGWVNQDSGLASLDWLLLGSKPTLPNTSNGTYVLQSGWLIVGTHETVGDTGFGTLSQIGGTNSTSDLAVGKGSYVKAGGGLFAGEVRVIAPSEPIFAPPTAMMTHAGGTATITNQVRVAGQGSRLNPRTASFKMLGGSLLTPRIHLEAAGMFVQSNGTVNISSELFIEDGGSRVPGNYYLFGGNLFAANTTISSGYPESSSLTQSGGTHIVTNTLWISGNAMYELSGGTVTVPNIVLSGALNNPPQFFVLGAPSLAITNQSISLSGGDVVIEDSGQQFGRLTITSDSGINLAGNSAILRFADSHTSSWQSDLQGVIPQLTVFNWNGSTNGGGTDQLSFGTSSSSLTEVQVAQIRFVNPAGFAAGTYPSRILSNGEVVPTLLPGPSLQNNGAALVLSWPGGLTLQSATNVAGPYSDLTNVSPYRVDVRQFPMEFFRLRD